MTITTRMKQPYENVWRDKQLKKSIRTLKNFSGVEPTSVIVKVFGCHSCIWINTLLCPHKILKGQHHSNMICSQRLKFLQENWELSGSQIKYFQREELVKLKLLSDSMLNDWADSGELHDKFDKISKNIITLTDKIRRQDEGIKIGGDISVSVTQLKDIIDTQAKSVDGKDIVKEAELIEDDNKQDNRKGTGVSKKEV